MPVHYSEMDEVISFIHQHMDEPLPLERLAKQAAYSPYHFTRLFKEKTGLPPLYYVSSLRLQKAKDLLLRTSWSVRDIGLEIGQQSLGTFTTRFTERVGMTPTEFRGSVQQTNHHLQELRSLQDWRTPRTVSASFDRIEGTVGAEVPFEGVILVGLFAKPIPEGIPMYGTVLSSLGSFSFTGVKPGTYYLMATSVSWSMQAMDVLLPQSTLRTRSKTPITVEPFTVVPHQEVMLHPPRLDDPPILISLPLLMNRFLHGMLRDSAGRGR
ncbi:helix-turn-helix domain-containing protein [Paenibacillus mucilaginosus]|uniref:Transcriptional regulator n=2 Tax=Paenibacillus mucilaginosus TaxID=61624 RepID=I0BMR7_9BACL|nr:helix-turn-helix transcriptional regulator [Paenibacillus mucilaginosus]AEI43709.1 probable transcriptional regulator [Paenibacillus mucilaginosus KNP414]AFH63664.1 transcriptional regulator [Paenibacillus mucilaginosus K02]MCG7212762.1 helix-turn-helix transcriptional regulator [Paenibacillus mucilaginosus]WDM25224.1 helix-turn-helix transcriptional regulator [Paenibacillus mucilaginosus]